MTPFSNGTCQQHVTRECVWFEMSPEGAIIEVSSAEDSAKCDNQTLSKDCENECGNNSLYSFQGMSKARYLEELLFGSVLRFFGDMAIVDMA